MTGSEMECSAGILLYRLVAAGGMEVLLVHPGGPFWARKDEGAWLIPKGLVDGGSNEDVLAAARREFAEETGHVVPERPALDLGEVRLRSGKRVYGFAVEGDLDPSTIVSNTFEMVWPPRSRRMQEFPEVDRGEWFGPADAVVKLNPAQSAFVERLVDRLGAS